MKKIIITAMAAALLTAMVSSVGAMEAMTATGDAMMAKDTMMQTGTMMKADDAMMKTDAMAKTDTMMKKDDSTMMKSDAMMAKKAATGNVSTIAAHYGYNWKHDRAALATAAGIKGYRGTANQNNKIRAYLLKMDVMK